MTLEARAARRELLAKVFLVLVMGTLLMAGCPRHYQETPLTGITGVVFDQEKAPVVGAEIQAQVGEAFRQLLSTDGEGSFHLEYVLDESGARRTLTRGDTVRLSVWLPDYLPVETSLEYPGVRVILPPFVLVRDLVEVDSLGLPGLEPGDTLPARPSTAQSQRGE